MNIIVTGPKGGKVPDALRSSVILAARSFAKQLNIHRLKANIKIRMHHSDLIDQYAEGYCDCVDLRNFVIDVCVYSNWITILAHEMVHVKQYARKELSICGRKWKKSKISDDVKYYDLPHEKEAFGLQHQLVLTYDKRPV